MIKSLHANLNCTYSHSYTRFHIVSAELTTSCDCLKGACPCYGVLFSRFFHGKFAETISVRVRSENLHELAPAAPELAYLILQVRRGLSTARSNLVHCTNLNDVMSGSCR